MGGDQEILRKARLARGTSRVRMGMTHLEDGGSQWMTVGKRRGLKLVS